MLSMSLRCAVRRRRRRRADRVFARPPRWCARTAYETGNIKVNNDGIFARLERRNGHAGSIVVFCSRCAAVVVVVVA